jgi:hypothetical protein
MLDAGSWAIVALTFVVLPLVTRPAVSRALGRLAERTADWWRAREAQRSAMDPEQEKLWLWSKRRRLCAALDRIERLVATDHWMSATRQLGNRLAFDQLTAELRRTPDVFPAALDGATVNLWAEPLPARTRRRRPAADREPARDRWDERTFDAGWAVAQNSPTGAGTVEVLELGWRRH